MTSRSPSSTPERMPRRATGSTGASPVSSQTSASSHIFGDYDPPKQAGSQDNEANAARLSWDTSPLSTFPSSHAPGRAQPPLAHSQTSYSPNTQAGRPFPSPGPPSESASPWSETLRRHGMGGSLFGVEGQQAMLALPGSEAPIPVHMDFSQASKKADEKRQRNAVASTRHRRKKKIMQEENAKQLQELRDERRLMEIRIEELIQQRDFYREDRNRLRDIVAQTPSISGIAAGPSSPTISTSNSYAETGSMSYGDGLSNERPAQRR
ncbi:unnamed protein product [Fusarium fujikuroi]|nr:unnamed protein product [Fusarium fujikuroi]